MTKTYQYRAYPTTKQACILIVWLEILRNLYNQALGWRKDAYKATGESVKQSTQEKALTPLRQESDTVAQVHIDVLQDAIDRLDKAYKAFFERVKKGATPGFPRFKGKQQRILSRREKGGKRRANQRHIVAKTHEHIANQRRDFHYKTAHQLFSQCEEVAVEDLKIRNMVQSTHNLAKSIS